MPTLGVEKDLFRIWDFEFRISGIEGARPCARGTIVQRPYSLLATRTVVSQFLEIRGFPNHHQGIAGVNGVRSRGIELHFFH